MREIKFRAWNGRAMLNEDYFHVRYGVAYRYPMFDEPEKTDYPLMQYTGLKDKNGVEIYEGDIVTSYNCNSPLEVTFRNACFCIKTLSGGISELYELAPVSQQAMEVIGNIYENPELLEK